MAVEGKIAGRVRPKIAVVGSSVMDLTTFSRKFPAAGETILADRFDLGFGGKGANQAVAAQLCEAEVSMISCVGQDAFGPAYLENFARYGIDTAGVHTIAGDSTGAATILVDPDSGQNRILVALGANQQITPEIVDRSAATLKHSDCMVMQCEMPLDAVYYAVEFAKRHRVRSILNVAPAQPIDLKRIDGLDYLIINETEAEAISGHRVRDRREAENCAQHLLTVSGIKQVIITLGAEGAILGSRGRTRHVPAFAMKAIDTTGAGDAFIGSFATFLSRGVEEEEAVGRANLYAGLSTLRTGTQKSFLSRDQFDREWAERNRLTVQTVNA
jgi:ribokinase